MKPAIPRALRVVASVAAAVPLALSLTFATTAHAGEPRTKVFLNGEAVPVFFNDGDSFRVLSGPMKGAKARIAGYNTLETHGAVHSWGKWTTKEMYVLAKIATYHARRGVWECTTDLKTDTYGRMLTFCPSLGKALIERGLAHAMTITDEPAKAEFLKAQKTAIANRAGIWFHGQPEFVLTSLHSVEEDLTGHGTYNRLVSSIDGHSVKWKHTSKYTECQNVCHAVYEVDPAEVTRLAKWISRNSAAKKLAGVNGANIESVARDFVHYRHINRLVPNKNREKLRLLLLGQVKDGPKQNGSCMVHVPFNRRFGGTRAACLR